ncbi:carboxypeptidase-like regulatory domain-containing protein [Rufibacter soli]
MKNLLLALLLLVSISTQAQRFQGKIVDQKNAPLPYVNIGVVGKNVGTVSSANGEFSLLLPDSLNAQTLLISAIGYAPSKFIVSEFKQKHAGQAAIIHLKEQAVALQEVVVRPRKTVTKVVGNTTTSKSIMAGFKSNSLGAEVGIALKIKKPSFLEKVTFNIAGNQYDTLFLRINVYKMTESGPAKNLLREPIYLNVAKKDIGDGVTLDLSNRHIYLESDVLLSLELVRDLGHGGLSFSGGFLNRDCYFRQTSQSTWEKIPVVGLGFNATISQEK